MCRFSLSESDVQSFPKFDILESWDLQEIPDSGLRDEKTHGANVDVEQCNPYGTSDISHDNNNRIWYQLVAFPCT